MGTGDRLALCLHGFPEHAISWRHQMPLLASLGYRVWAPNLRGYGNTDAPRTVSAYDLPVLVEDIAALIRASEAREVLLIGHDWGGLLAWILAMRGEQRVRRAVVCNLPHPACLLRELRHPRQFLRSWYILFFQIPKLPEWLLGLRGGYLVGRVIRGTARFPEAVLDVYRRNAARPGRLTAMLSWYRALGRGGWRRMPGRRHWPTIEIPVLLLWGDKDVALSVHTTDGTEEFAPRLTRHILPGVSHWVQQDAPEAVNTLLAAWLQG